MKDLLTCVLALTWAWGLIWYLGRRKHPYERPDNIDREFRDLVARARRNPATLSGPWHETALPNPMGGRDWVIYEFGDPNGQSAH